jgi:hypothetical protein
MRFNGARRGSSRRAPIRDVKDLARRVEAAPISIPRSLRIFAPRGSCSISKPFPQHSLDYHSAYFHPAQPAYLRAARLLFDLKPFNTTFARLPHYHTFLKSSPFNP